MSNHILTREGKWLTISDDELTHASHKYVKREKVNGKWRYWYDIGEASYIDGWTGKKPSNLKSYSKLEDILGKDEQDRFNRAASRVALAKENHYATRNSENRELAAKMQSKYLDEGKKFCEANNAYMKTPLGKLNQLKNNIDSAKSAVGKFFERVGKKLQQ